LYRAQILLEPEQHRTLSAIAKREGRSISDLVREIVRQHLAEREQADRRQAEMQAIQELAQIREQLQEQHGVYQVDLLAKVRTEREQDVERVWGDEV
jgi:metal-responsive CopG/Arc/MetJ family transcriptional regulator